MESTTGVVEQNTATQRSKKGRDGTHLLLEVKLVFTLVLLGILFSLILVGGYAFSIRQPNFDIASISLAYLGVLIPAEVLLYLGIGSFACSMLLLFGWRINISRNVAFKRSNGCPNCKEHDLLRVQRHQAERIAGKLALLRLNRCACRNCSWQGLLIGAKHSVPADWLSRPTHEPEDEAWLNVRSGRASEDNRDLFKQVPQHVGNGSPPANLDLGQVEIIKPASELVDGSQDGADVPSATNTEATSEDESLLSDDPADTDILQVDSDEEPATVDVTSTSSSEIVDDETGPASTVVENTQDDLVVSLDIEQKQGVEESELEPEPDFIESLATEVKPLIEEPVLQEPASLGETNYSSLNQTDSITEFASFQVEDKVVAQALVVSPFGLKLRDEPHTDARVLRVLKRDDVVSLLQEREMDSRATWRHVMVGRETGWVSAAFLKRLHGGNQTGDAL